MFSAGDTVSLNRSMDAALHTLRDSGDKWLQKGFQELLDNDFISFWAQCPTTLQIVRGGECGCVCAIDLGHLIRQPGDRLLTSNGGGINPFQNIPLPFSLGSARFFPSRAGRRTVQNCSIRFTTLIIFFFFLWIQCFMGFTRTSNLHFYQPQKQLGLFFVVLFFYSPENLICWKLRGVLSRSFLQLTDIIERIIFVLQRLQAFLMKQVILSRMFTAVMRDGSSGKHLARGVPEDIRWISH